MLPPTHASPTRRLASGLLFLLFLTTSAWGLVSSWDRFGRIPSNDYFGVVAHLAEGTQWSTDPGVWLGIRSNEHHVVIPAVLYRLNAALFHGDNRGMVAWSLLMMAATATLLALLLPPGFGDRPLAFAAAALPITILATVPSAVHNVAMGFSGMMWLTSNALSLGALVCLHRGRHQPWGVVGAVLLAGLASITYSTGLSSWAILLLLVVLQGQGIRRFVAIALPAVGVITASLTSYRRPGHLPEPASDTGQLSEYVATYLGGIFSDRVEAAQAWGTIALGSIVLVYVLLPALLSPQRRRTHWAPWMAVGLFGLINAVGTGIGRSGFGVSQALASRYGTLSALVWVSLLLPPIVWSLDSVRGRGGRRTSILAALSWLALVLIWQGPLRELGRDRTDRFVTRGSYQPVASLALVHGIPDGELIERGVTRAPHQAWNLRDFLRARNQVPFHGLESSPTSRLSQRGRRLKESGVLGEAVLLPDGWIRIEGWLHVVGQPIREVVLADVDGTILGPIAYGVHRHDLVRIRGEEARASGFFGYLRPTETTKRPRVWFRTDEEGPYRQLPTSETFVEQWRRLRQGPTEPSIQPDDEPISTPD